MIWFQTKAIYLSLYALYSFPKIQVSRSPTKNSTQKFIDATLPIRTEPFYYSFPIIDFFGEGAEYICFWFLNILLCWFPSRKKIENKTGIIFEYS